MIETSHYKNHKVEKNDFDLEALERKTIKQAINAYDHNMTKVAKALGISRNTLYLKIKKYEIEV